ncbi:MAG: hypothetical protein ACI4QS_09705 [Comamonas sp.]
MCKLTSRIHVGNALWVTGSSGTIAASTPIAAAAAGGKGLIFGLGWNELGILVGAIVGIAGLAFSQYWAYQRDRREQAWHDAQLAALKKG